MPREQDQFLDVIPPTLAARRWADAARPDRLGAEPVRLDRALGRVLAVDRIARVDVPGFDRSNLDGYAVRAQDTFGASEGAPVSLAINEEELATGVVPRVIVAPGTATPIATGGMLPRGADAVAMVEITRIEDPSIASGVLTWVPLVVPDQCSPGPSGHWSGTTSGTRIATTRDRVLVSKPVAPGSGVTFAGTDLARGELALRAGTRLTPREIGVLAAIGEATVPVVRRPRVAILSTGDEIVPPGQPLPLGSVYDSNAAILAASVVEAGGEPIAMGIVGDSISSLSEALDRAIAASDLVILSGGTSKGAGDLSYRVLALREPGIVVHGVALKPGKPVCLGAIGRVPVAILPGFPTSAVFTFHEFVAPRIRAMAGLRDSNPETIAATLAARVNSDRGRTEFVLVHLVQGEAGLVAYPMGKGSGSVTAYSRADGFFSIAEADEFADAGEAVTVTPLGARIEVADLTVIGSHCAGLDHLLSRLAARAITSKTLWVGSQGGLSAAARGECDIAGVHLLDPVTGVYNQPFLPTGVRLLRGYGRMQGIVSRRGDDRFEGADALAKTFDDPSVAMVNRNRGSGTRILIDGLLSGKRPPGYAIEASSHNAACAAIAQGRADWGVAIATVARDYDLQCVPLREERYDFAVPEARWDRPAVVAFRALLDDPEVRSHLAEMGYTA